MSDKELLKWTYWQLAKHLSLIEDHLLWMFWNNENEWCRNCIRTHCRKIEGYCEEGTKFGDGWKFLSLLSFMNCFYEIINNIRHFELLREIPRIRKFRLEVEYALSLATQKEKKKTKKKK